MPSALFQRAQHELDRKFAAVLAPASQLDAGTDLLRQSVLRGAKVVSDQPLREALGNDVLDLLAEEFIAAVAELFLRLNIQQNDLAALVHHHHRVGCRFQEPAVPALHLRQMVFRRLAYADVADRRRHQDTFGAFQRAQHELDRKLAAVLAPRRELDPGPDLLRQRFGRGAGSVGDQPFGEALRNDVRHLLTEEFIAAVAELLLRLNIEEDDLPALVHHHHRVRRSFQQPAILRPQLDAVGQVVADDRKPSHSAGCVPQRREGGAHRESRPSRRRRMPSSSCRPLAAAKRSSSGGRPRATSSAGKKREKF